MKRKSFLTFLIVVLATASCFAWVVMKYYGTISLTATPQVEKGIILSDGEQDLSLENIEAPILSSADGVNFFNEAGEKVEKPTATTFKVSGSDCNTFKVTADCGDDALSNAIRIGVQYDGGGDVLSNGKTINIGKTYSQATDMKIMVWYDGKSTTDELISLSEGTSVTLKLVAQ